ncbi:MAG: NADPH-dependent assimilatory sulfite reductase hemoprotein subunit, partial [Planctomycetota bacterium]|nr:NADPH-dependent assimilatory sulfite reductase hemoprotein subunit [Planctomycetota bacterium]
MAEPTKKPSPVEVFKIQSQYLRGGIPEELVDENDFFGKGSIQLLKHHGTYQQDNREERTAREGMKSLKNFSFMVRSRIPGGRLTSPQLLAEMDIGDELGTSTLRITSRQSLQLHGIPKRSLRETIRRINEIKLSTLAACGDVQRNFMCCPAPNHNSPLHEEMFALANELALYFAPRSSAYYEIWVKDLSTGEDQMVCEVGPPQPLPSPQLMDNPPDPVEPIYGPTYLPRKFKTAFAFADDNCTDLYSNDMGFMAIVENGTIIGYNVLVGGGMGVTPANKQTFPAVAKRLCYVRPDQVKDVATAVVKVQRDYGNRTDRKLARMKYLIANWGIEKFKAKVEEYYGQPLPDPHPTDVHGHDDHMGWHEQGDGRWFYGLNVENGRIHDTGPVQIKTAFRKICHELAPEIRLTAHQSILFCNLTAEQRPRLEQILREHGVRLTEETST